MKKPKTINVHDIEELSITPGLDGFTMHIYNSHYAIHLHFEAWWTEDIAPEIWKQIDYVKSCLDDMECAMCKGC